MFFTCPETLKPIETAISTSPQALAACWGEEMTVFCPHCRKAHKLKIREAYFEEAGSSNEPHLRASDTRYDRRV